MSRPMSLLSLLCLILPLAAGAQEAKSVAITQIVEHPSLDACRQGVEDGLAEAGWKVGENLDWSYESAQSNPVTAVQVARKFVGQAPDVIVAISTPSAQAVAAATHDIPLVFSAVTDPLEAKLVANLEHPGGNITGTTDALPLERHLDLIARISPAAKRIGVLYNPGEVNSVATVERLKALAPDRGLTIVEGAAPRTADVLAAARSLVGRVDALYVPTDNTVVAALEGVVKTGYDARLPVYTADTDSVERGALAAVGFNYYDVGRQTGAMVARILAGEAPGDIPVAAVEKTELHLNLRSAERMGVTVPEAVVAEAARVIR
ncbi:ABC transporter substrate-binding protein [Thioalbus denitrificans]|uniref:Putative ABC transport system substrate-binding protein n=1 Tax=Thioalbus denitrificans TaxID=547122 RepID=A0A369BYB0_9GAMM|nr:ABC transporter substrate-binding protein [Thioalbus denitrificans]RCX26483.1 putative ABC transport system substrate-binding protein [Thioalbus denitrificans]